MKNLNRRGMLERKSAQAVSKWPIRQESNCLYSTLMLFLFGLIWFGSVIDISNYRKMCRGAGLHKIHKESFL